METPCLIIDARRTRRNIARMAARAQALHVRLRPHAKTHKLPSLAAEQIAAGAAGITVAKVSEAEVMAQHGIGDIFVAYPLVVPSKIERAAKLSRQIRLIVSADSYEGALRLSEIAGRQGIVLEVRLEVDTGLRRTGTPREQAVQLASRIHALPHLRLQGIYTFRGPLLDGRSTLELERAGVEEGMWMAQLADEMRAAGIPVEDVSVGSTPTGLYAASVPGITEIRPGTYVFNDAMQTRLGVSSWEDCAGSILATVVSRPSPDYAVIDGGSKTFATDVQPNTEPLLLQGFGRVVEWPDAVLERMTEEHGMLRLLPHHELNVGDQVHIIPNHICSTLNLHNKLYWVDGDLIEERPILARGMLE
ncbi:amino acid aldolase [Paenibacillus lycopersici]|uniref:Amino acid aldolase n=1 Tax=Paenibacillus lycopersici TaxID=2704462 RepID=A0A6C0FXL5_9BACL|nr:alanine racemase [Paenibacillus lycopersici]QHT58940.1 amino acid aldolase [Paenibacillus lycopersici]